MSDAQAIGVYLAMLAKQTGEQLEPQRLSFYRERLEPLGASAVCAALANLLESARRFPTVAEIKAAMGLQAPSLPSPDDVGREVAERIWASISRFGSLYNTKPIEEAVGEVAWHVVRLSGGWRSICDIATNENATTLKAQWRELAKGVLAKKRAGLSLDAPPTFDSKPTLPERAQAAVRQLSDRMGAKPNG